MERTASIHRQTKETDIAVTLNLDGTGEKAALKPESGSWIIC